jgi:hypothetical protein
MKIYPGLFLVSLVFSGRAVAAEPTHYDCRASDWTVEYLVGSHGWIKISHEQEVHIFTPSDIYVEDLSVGKLLSMQIRPTLRLGILLPQSPFDVHVPAFLLTTPLLSMVTTPDPEAPGGIRYESAADLMGCEVYTDAHSERR